MSLFPKELHTFSKMTHVNIKMIALNFIKASLFPKELYTFAKMKHVSGKVNFSNLDPIYSNPCYFQMN